MMQSQGGTLPPRRRPFHAPLRFGTLAAGVLLAPLFVTPVLAQSDDDATTQPETQETPEVTIVQAIDGPYFVTWVSAAVREAPDGASTREATLSFGDQVFVTGRVGSGPWYRVELDDGTIGYVWQEVLAPMRVTLPGQPTGGEAAGDGSGDFIASDDNDMGTAQPLGDLGTSPITRQAWVGPDDDSDFYSFQVSDWTQVSLSLTGMDNDADISLMDADGNYIADSAAAGSADESVETTIGAGTYFIEVYMYEGSTPYTMTLSGTPGEPPPEDTVGNDPASASALGDLTGGSATASEWVGTADQADAYSFTVSERSHVTVNLDGLSDDADISLEDDFGTVLASSAEGGTNPEVMETDVDPGTYYVIIVPFTGSTNYDLSVSASAAGPAPDDHAGNTPAEARQVEVGTGETFSDWVGASDPADFYTFTVTDPTRLILSLSGLSSDVDVELLDSDGTTVLASSLNPGTDDERIDWQLAPGTYYARVYIFDGQSTYDLTFNVGD